MAGRELTALLLRSLLACLVLLRAAGAPTLKPEPRDILWGRCETLPSAQVGAATTAARR